MSAREFSQSTQSCRPASVGTKLTVGVVLAAWFAFVFAFGAAQGFVPTLGTPPLAIAIGVTVPIVLFLAGFRLWNSFREFVLTIDVRTMLAIQAWRFTGIAFLALYTWGVLPGSFALPAGLGDIAIGVTAPLMLIAVLRRPRFAAGKSFAVWNVLGISDLVVAVGSGALGAILATGAAGEVTTAPVTQMPLVLIPAFFVPVFIMLHLAALFQARQHGGDSVKI